VGALGQPHRAWEGFQADPNPVSLTPAKSKHLEDARSWLLVGNCLSVQTKSQTTKSRLLNCGTPLDQTLLWTSTQSGGLAFRGTRTEPLEEVI
jgi:hypothetical protein